MRAFKGFNKDLTCRGYQYEEGKEFHTERAECCDTGFHACKYPLDCLSANEYMENVTSFSASLLSACAGDTNKSAEIANKAMIDMADNANKMGTDMGSIQNAYQGFAKQNYTMLDNLKLGYGGTKEEMDTVVRQDRLR